MDEQGSGAPNSKSLSGQSRDSGNERNGPPRRNSAILGRPMRGLPPWKMSAGRVLPAASEGRFTPFRSSASSVTRTSRLIRRPVVQNLEDPFNFQTGQPQVVRDDGVSCFFDIKPSITPHTPDGTTSLVTTTTTEAHDEGIAAPNTSTAKRGSAVLSDEERKLRNREYAKRHRMKSLEAKSRQEQYIAELESQCNTLHTQVEAGRTRIHELEEQVERMSVTAARYAMLEGQVRSLEEENRALRMEQEIKPASLATSIPAVDGHPSSTVDLGTSLDPLNYLTPHHPGTTQGFGFL